MKSTAERGPGIRRAISVLGAATNVGIKPYDDVQEPRHLDRAPHILRSLGLLARLSAEDVGDVLGPVYTDFSRSPGAVRNEGAVAAYSQSLSTSVSSEVTRGRFPLVIGGDCSIVLGCLLGVKEHRNRLGLVYIDAHADFGTPEESVTGSAASMCLAMAVGRGESRLANLAGKSGLIRAEDVVLIGRRDMGQRYYGHEALATSGILDVPGDRLASLGPEAAAQLALDRLGDSGVDGFWIHVDADVFSPEVMPAVDSPEPGGPGISEIATLVRALVSDERAVGMELTIYDPRLDDEEKTSGRRVIAFLEQALARDEMGKMPAGAIV